MSHGKVLWSSFLFGTCKNQIKLKFQLVLWTGSSQILLSWMNCLSPCLLGKWEWKVTCHGWANGPFFKPGSEIDFFRQHFFSVAKWNRQMWSPKSVGKTFPFQWNTSQNYWSRRACWQNTCICNQCNQESNQCWNAEKTWQRSFTLFVAVKHCGRFIIKGKRFYTSKATER